MMQEKINMKVDTAAIDQEIANTRSSCASIIPSRRSWRRRLILLTRTTGTMCGARQTLMTGSTRCMIRSRIPNLC